MPSSAAIAAGDVRGLDQMAEHVLAVGGAVLQPADQGDQLGVQVGDPDVEQRVLGGPPAEHLDLVAGPLVGLLDAVRVDPAVLDQHLQGDPADLPADRVEAGQQHRLRGVVDDDVDAGDGLEGADVAALAADDPALDLVGGQVHDRDDGLRGLVGRHPLDRLGDDRPGPLLGGSSAASRLDPADHHGRVAADRLLLAGPAARPGRPRRSARRSGPVRPRWRGRGRVELAFALGRARRLGRAARRCLARPAPRPWPPATACARGAARPARPADPLGGRRPAACCSSASASLAAGQPLLGLLELLAVLGQRRGGLDGDPVALGFEVRPAARRPGRGRRRRSARPPPWRRLRICSASRRGPDRTARRRPRRPRGRVRGLRGRWPRALSSGESTADRARPSRSRSLGGRVCGCSGLGRPLPNQPAQRRPRRPAGAGRRPAAEPGRAPPRPRPAAQTVSDDRRRALGHPAHLPSSAPPGRQPGRGCPARRTAGGSPTPTTRVRPPTRRHDAGRPRRVRPWPGRGEVRHDCAAIGRAPRSCA